MKTQVKKSKKTEVEKFNFIEVPELGIKITPVQYFNGKIYSEIFEEVDESQIATYEILQKLRNISFESGWKEYPFMKSFWVFVLNPDNVSKANGYFARFVAYSGGAFLDCYRYPSGGCSGLGVFLYCPIISKARKK